jgi:hypothetical protein
MTVPGMSASLPIAADDEHAGAGATPLDADHQTASPARR